MCLCLQAGLPAGLTPFTIIKDPSFSPVTFLFVCFVACFVWFQYRHSSFLLVTACVVYLFPSIRFPPICSFASEVCLLYAGPSYIPVLTESNPAVSAFWSDCLLLSHLTLRFTQLDLYLPLYFLFPMCPMLVWLLCSSFCFFLHGFTTLLKAFS